MNLIPGSSPMISSVNIQTQKKYITTLLYSHAIQNIQQIANTDAAKKLKQSS